MGPTSGCHILPPSWLIGGMVVMIPDVDCSYVFPFYLMPHHFLPTLPAIPMHDPRGRHVIQHHMTDSLGHLPAVRVNTCHSAHLLLYHYLMLTYGPYGYVSACLSLWIAIELDHR